MTRFVRLPADAGRWGCFFLSMMLAVWLSFGLRFLYNVAAFWLLDQRGVGALVSATAIFLSGFLVPLNYFPDWAQAIITWLPFAGMLQAPIEVLLGKLTGAALASALVSRQPGRLYSWQLIGCCWRWPCEE